MEDSFACGVNRASRLNKTLYSLPVHCLTAEDLQLENAKGIMRHFHSPENSRNRFLASLTQQDRAILRQIERPAEYKHAAREAGEHCRTTNGMTKCSDQMHSKLVDEATCNGSTSAGAYLLLCWCCRLEQSCAPQQCTSADTCQRAQCKQQHP